MSRRAPRDIDLLTIIHEQQEHQTKAARLTAQSRRLRNLFRRSSLQAEAAREQAIADSLKASIYSPWR